jgi:cytochrome bd-type quinol oxidase subunit 2
MGFAFLPIAAVFGRRSRLERVIRILFFTTALLALVSLALIYGMDLEYRYEVAVILIDWSALIVCGVLLSILCAQSRKQAT